MSSWSPSTAGGSSWGQYIPSVKTMSSAVCGAGAVASEVLGAVSSSVPRDSTISQWMPPSVQAYLPGRDANRNTEDRDQVVSVTFDADFGSPAHPQFLCMCFRNGFQVWEVQDQSEASTQATRETQPLREVLSVRQGYTRLARMLPTVEVPDTSVLHGQQPALAVVSGDEVGDANVLRLFSVKSHAFFHKLRFHGDVHGVVCNARWMVVVLKNQLLIHSLKDLSLSQTYSTFPSPTPSGVLALGPRWLAYASNQPLRADATGAAPATTYGSPLLDVGVGVAGMAASGAKQLGEIGLRTLNSYLSSSPPTLAEPTEPAMDYAGSVIVRDIDTQQVLHHFRAHDAPLGIIKFDPSGLLLVTAAIDGRNINLFEIDPGTEPGRSTPLAPKHLYKLVRGVTSSSIQDIAFSIDTRWVAVTSTRGTAHLYPVNPDGTPASVETHVPSPAVNAAWPLYPLSASYAAVPSPPITVFAVARIRTSDGAASGGGGACESAAACVQFSLPAASTVYTQYPPAVSAVCMVSGDGVLARYQLRPFAMADAETQSEALQLEMQCQGTLDICRRRAWPEQQCPAERLACWAAPPASAPAQGPGCMPEWVSHVEIYTHERGEDSVWASRMFKFKTFDAAPPPARGPHLQLEQLPCAQLGAAASPSPDGCRGEDVEELEDYFVVQTCPKPAGAPAMHSGVYGGLPPALGGGGESGKGRGEAAGGEAVPALSKSRSMDIAGSSAGSRDAVWGGGGKRDEDVFAHKGGAELDLDWGEEEEEEDGEGSDGAGTGGEGGEHGSPGLAASSMLLFDEELDGGGAPHTLSAAPTREKCPAGQVDLLDFVLEGDQAGAAEGGGGGKGGLDGSCAAASVELNEGGFGEDPDMDNELADFLASSSANCPDMDAASAIAAKSEEEWGEGGGEGGGGEGDMPPTEVAQAAGGGEDLEEEVNGVGLEEEEEEEEKAGMREVLSGLGGLETKAGAAPPPPRVSAVSPESPQSPPEGEDSPPELADPEQEEEEGPTEPKPSGAAVLSKRDKKKKKKAKR